MFREPGIHILQSGQLRRRNILSTHVLISHYDPSVARESVKEYRSSTTSLATLKGFSVLRNTKVKKLAHRISSKSHNLQGPYAYNTNYEISVIFNFLVTQMKKRLRLKAKLRHDVNQRSFSEIRQAKRRAHLKRSYLLHARAARTTGTEVTSK